MIENSLNEYFKDTDKEQKDFVWQEYTLEELNCLLADKILQGVKEYRKTSRILLNISVARKELY